MTKINSLSRALAVLLQENKFVLTTAESCTGGWVSQSITETPGCSKWFDRGFVSYSNQSKIEMLGVPLAILENFGAVSKETAIAMAQGAIKNSKAQISMSITGLAGPGGGSKEKPVGTVWIGMSHLEISTAKQHYFTGNRHQIRQQATTSGLLLLIQHLEGYRRSL